MSIHTSEGKNMSEQSTTAQDTNVTDKPKVTRTRKPKAERVPFKDVINAHARKRNIDRTRAGKELRARGRREFATIAKLDPVYFGAKGQHKEEANDGRPWVSVNTKVRDHLLSGKVSKSS